MKKIIGWIIMAGIIGFVAFRIIQGVAEKRGGAKKSIEGVEGVYTVEVIESTKSNIKSTLSFTGTLKGENQIRVFSDAPGKLLEYTVEEGDVVKKDEVIALVDRAIKGMEFQPVKINSPISGVVGMLSLDKGERVSPQSPVAVISNIDKIKAEIWVTENDLPNVHKGQSAVITLDVYPDKDFHGKLSQLSPFVNPVTRTVRGEITIPNPDHFLKPGMFARVELTIEEHSNAIVVPDKAVIERNGKKVVFVLQGERAKMCEVETGIENKGFIEILKGLKMGEKVITLGNYGLPDGARIDVR